MPASVQTTFFAGNVLRVAEKDMLPRMTRIATEYANEVKLRMRNSPATGRVYGLRRTRRGKRVLGPAFARGAGRVHRASAPGEPPAPDTGALMRSVSWQVRNDGHVWFAEVGSDLKYAIPLEHGAAAGVKNRSGKVTKVQWILFPRPVWGPSLAALRPRFAEIMAGRP
jgi:hypothetical protein